MDSNNSTPARRPPFQRTWLRKFSDAFRGLGFALRTQNSLHVHLAVAVVVLAVACWWRVPPVEWCLLVLCIGLVLSVELLNTSIERLAKAVRQDYHPDIRDALDIGSAAALAAALVAVAVGALVFIPHFWQYLAP